MKIIKPSKESFLSPTAIFIFYLLFSSLAVLGFRYLFPGEEPPLPSFDRDWRRIQGISAALFLLPALILAALVFPFGLYSGYEPEQTRFSPRFFQRLKGPIVAAICASLLYGLLFFLVQPMVQDSKADLRSRGLFFRQALIQVQLHVERGEWPQAAYFIGLCERVWPESPELEDLKQETDVQLAELRGREHVSMMEQEYQDSDLSNFIGQRQPVSAAEALVMAATAQREERFYDAHWLATLAGRLARPGAPEAAEASRMAALARNSMSSLEPSTRDQELYALYRLKQSGYEAMISGEWIRAYYIFLELRTLTPGDPDVVNFLAQSEQGTKETAFFIDETDIGVGETITNAVFSLPTGPPGGGGRGVLRFSALLLFADYAYGFGAEFVSFDREDRVLSQFTAPYVKILPLTLNSQAQTIILMQALDRYNESRRLGPLWTVPTTGDNQFMLDIDYETFYLLTKLRRGIEELSIGQLFWAARSLEPYGYIPQVFQSELIYRLAEPLFLLPMAIIAIIAGWRFRALKRSRYAVVLMLFVLPLVFNGLVYFYRYILNILGIWTVLSLGFSTALLIYAAGAGILFILSLVLLASQHG
jgi:hypothetical protein